MAGTKKQVKAKARNISGTKTATDMKKRTSTPKATGNKIAKPNGLVVARNNDVAMKKMKTPARKAVENGGVDVTGAKARKKIDAKPKANGNKITKTATPRIGAAVDKKKSAITGNNRVPLKEAPKPKLVPIEEAPKPKLVPIEEAPKPKLVPIKPRYSSRVTKPNEKNKFYM